MKKIFAFVLALMLCVSVLSVTAMASESAYLYVSSAETHAGETVTLSVSLGGNTGIAGMRLSYSYDPSVLELVGVSGVPFGGVWTIGSVAVWDSGANTDYNGQILTMTFKVLDTAAVGTSTNVSVSCMQAFKWSEDGKAYEAVSVGGSTGTVKIVCNHAWDNGKVTKAATCTENGVMTYTCSICGETKTADIPAAHKWNTVWSFNTEKHWHECSVCGAIKDESIHHMDVIADQAPTKEEDGWLLWGCHECDYEWREVWEYGEEPKVGDIRPMIMMTITGIVATLAAAAYIFKRKNVI